jgi:hypothetical protein
MTRNSVSTDNVQITDVRAILADDFSSTETNRIIMTIKTTVPGVSSIALTDLRAILAEDFSAMKINRVMMSLKCFCLKAYQ